MSHLGRRHVIGSVRDEVGHEASLRRGRSARDDNGAMLAPDPTLITFLYVTDLEASHAFYSDALGLPLAVDQGDCRIYRVNAGAFLGICARPDRMSVGGLITTIVTDDVEAQHERLLAAGVEVVTPPEHSEHYRITHAFYRDPDGHLVEVQRFDDPNWANASRS